MPHKKKRILIIDDDIEILNSLKILLENKYKILTINDSLKVMGALEDFEPHLIVLDSDLPLINGPTLCGRIKKLAKFKDIPVIFISCFTNGFYRKKAMDAGADLYVEKPFDYEKFADTIGQFLNPADKEDQKKPKSSKE